MQQLEMLSAALGLLGAILLASRSRWAGWAFVAWLISNIGWIVFGAGHQQWFFIAQQVGFTVTSVLGIWNWLVHPALRGVEASLPNEFPAGAIVNGRTHIERLESLYSFECEAGPLSICCDWEGLKRCFEHLAGEAEAEHWNASERRGGAR